MLAKRNCKNQERSFGYLVCKVFMLGKNLVESEQLMTQEINNIISGTKFSSS